MSKDIWTAEVRVHLTLPANPSYTALMKHIYVKFYNIVSICCMLELWWSNRPYCRRSVNFKNMRSTPKLYIMLYIYVLECWCVFWSPLEKCGGGGDSPLLIVFMPVKCFPSSNANFNLVKPRPSEFKLSMVN